MVLLRRVGYRQTKLLEKTTKNNLGLEKLELIGEEDLEGTKKEAGPKQKVERLEQETKREIREETGPE